MQVMIENRRDLSTSTGKTQAEISTSQLNLSFRYMPVLLLLNICLLQSKC